MGKELKKELFNIYDIVVFEDENGITQDCVCVIGKDKEVDEIVDMVECNNHSISIYENGSYKVWEKDGKNKPYYATNKKIIHLYTLKNDNRFYEIYPTNDYESIDNANPSEALECVEDLIFNFSVDEYVDRYDNNLQVITQALLKAQEPKKNYLKWEDLEFKEERQEIPVRMGETIYTLVLRKTDGGNKIAKLLSPKRNYMGEWGDMFYEEAKQFFNDLHLERVEE